MSLMTDVETHHTAHSLSGGKQIVRTIFNTGSIILFHKIVPVNPHAGWCALHFVRFGVGSAERYSSIIVTESWVGFWRLDYMIPCILSLPHRKDRRTVVVLCPFVDHGSIYVPGMIYTLCNVRVGIDYI